MKKQLMFILLGCILLSHNIITTGFQCTYTAEEQTKITQSYEYQVHMLMINLITAHARNKPEEATKAYSEIIQLSNAVTVYAQAAEQYHQNLSQQ